MPVVLRRITVEAPQYKSLFAHDYTVVESDGNDSRTVDNVCLKHQEITNYLVAQLGEDCEIDESQEFEVSGTAYDPVDEDDDLQDTPHTTLTLDYLRAHRDCNHETLSQVLQWHLDEQFELLAYNLARVLWCQTTHPEWTEGAKLQAYEGIATVSQLLSMTYTMIHMLQWFPRWGIRDLDTWLKQFQFEQLPGADKLLEKFVFQIKEVTVDSGRSTDKVSD
jgi:hypothetical protein